MWCFALRDIHEKGKASQTHTLGSTVWIPVVLPIIVFLFKRSYRLECCIIHFGIFKAKFLAFLSAVRVLSKISPTPPYPSVRRRQQWLLFLPTLHSHERLTMNLYSLTSLFFLWSFHSCFRLRASRSGAPESCFRHSTFNSLLRIPVNCEQGEYYSQQKI